MNNAAAWKKVYVLPQQDDSVRVLTVFNEDEVLFVEILDDLEVATAAENWYASLGFGVSVEVQ